MRRHARLLLLLLGALLLSALPAAAGVVELRNGEEIRGEILDVTALEVSVRVAGGGLVRLRLEQVRDIRLDSGESVFSPRMREARRRLAEQRRFRGEERRPGGASRPRHPARAEPVPPAPASDTGDRLSLGASYRSQMHAFALRFPSGWSAKQTQTDYYTFQPKSLPGSKPEGESHWRFNITVFEAFEATVEDVKEATATELEGIDGYRTVLRRTIRVAGRQGERSSGLFRRGKLEIRHEQVIVPAWRERVLLLNFFFPGRKAGTSPEVDAVLRSLRVQP